MSDIGTETAFPAPHTNRVCDRYGLTKLEYFAGQSIPTAAALVDADNKIEDPHVSRLIARKAVKLGRALCDELARQEKGAQSGE